MMDPVDMWSDIEEFHSKYGLEYEEGPRALPPDLRKFREGFLEEELREYKEATARVQEYINDGQIKGIAPELENALDVLVDLTYVALGTALMHGFDFKEAWYRVHRANMMKVRVKKEEDSKRGSTYDVVKPPNWVAPNHSDLVSDHVHYQGDLFDE